MAHPVLPITQLQRVELEKIILQAGTSLMSYWPADGGPRDLEIETKKDGSLVTKADFESNDILIAGLKKLFPMDGIFSEEQDGWNEKVNAVSTWIIDPLDGTKSFTEGNDDFSVLLGRCVQKQIDFGMMYFPARKLFAWGENGKGAVVNETRMQVSTSKVFRDRAVYLRHLKSSQENFVYDRWLDSGMAFLNLCRGEFDGVIIKLKHHQEWDLAAATLLIKESGGEVTDEAGIPFLFNLAPVKSGYFVASNGKTHSALLDLIKKNENQD